MFMPFLLDKVAGHPDLNQADGIHPNTQGAQIVADTVWSVLRPALDQIVRVMIELRGVCKRVPSGSGTLTILHPLDLTIPSGRVVAITGPSGSGKSTLLGLLAGLDSPSDGHVVLDGVDITALDEDALARLRGQRIGFVFQFFHLLPSLTALENVLVPMEIAGAPQPGPRAHALLARGRAQPTAAITIRRSCRAASSSAWRSPARSPTIRRCCSPTNRPATSTARPDTRSSSCCST